MRVTFRLAGVLIINNGLTVIKSFQSLTRYYGDLKVVTFDPRTTSVVCQGVPGHIQFFSVEKDTQLYNVSPLDSRCKELVDVELLSQLRDRAQLFAAILCIIIEYKTFFRI